MEQNQECRDLQESQRENMGNKVLNKAAIYNFLKSDLYTKEELGQRKLNKPERWVLKKGMMNNYAHTHTYTPPQKALE